MYTYYKHVCFMYVNRMVRYVYAQYILLTLHDKCVGVPEEPEEA